MSPQEKLLLDPAVVESYRIMQARYGCAAAEAWLNQQVKIQKQLERN